MHRTRVQIESLLELEHALRQRPGGFNYLAEPHQTGGKPRESRRAFLYRQQSISTDGLIKLARNPGRSSSLRAVALRFLTQGGHHVDVEFLRELTAVPQPVLRREAVLTLQELGSPEGDRVLRSLAADESKPVPLRAEATLGLAHRADVDSSSRRLLIRLAQSSEPLLQYESLRSLRGLAANHQDVRQRLLDLAQGRASTDPTRSPLPSEPTSEPEAANRYNLAAHVLLAWGTADTEMLPQGFARRARQDRPDQEDVRGWTALLLKGGDARSGRRVFFHPNGPGCYRCHSVRGRGDWTGPALSQVGRSMSRRNLVESVVAPSREIPFPFLSTVVVTKEGKTYTGMIVTESETRLTLLTSNGETVTLRTDTVDHRTSQRTSVMPANLIDRMTTEEFRDLIAFLKSLK